MREAKTARDSELKTKTEAVEKELALRKENYDADLAEKNGEKKKIEDDLEKLASSQVKISVKDAEAILEEFRAADDADREIRLNQAKEDVERAKNEYLEAVELRAQFERERDDAVISAKEDAKRKLALEKAQAETEAKVGYITAETDQTAQAAQSVQTPVDETAEEKTGTTEYVATEEVATEEKPETTEETPGTETVTEETPGTETVTKETMAEETVTAEPAEEKAEETDETATEEIVAEETESAENDASIALESLETAISDEDKKLSEEVIAEVEEAEEAATVSEAGAEAEATDTAKTEETASPEPAETEESIETTEPAEESANEEPTADEAVEEPTADEAVEEPTETIAEPTTEETPEEIPEEIPEEVTEKVATEPANDEKIIRIPRDIYNDGIPATPIHKKSKYAKPVTKLLVKKPVVKEEPEQNVQTKEEARKSAYLGKWKVEKTEDGKLFAKLRASNGGILLTTPLYTSEIGLKNGITAIKKSLAADNVTVTANKAGKFVFKITAPSGRTIVTSEQYAARFQCEKALDSAKRFAETAVITE